jgi:hypothetical protein
MLIMTMRGQSEVWCVSLNPAHPYVMDGAHLRRVSWLIRVPSEDSAIRRSDVGKEFAVLGKWFK